MTTLTIDRQQSALTDALVVAKRHLQHLRVVPAKLREQA